MFRWLIKMIMGHKKKDTEIRNLKDEIRNCVEQNKAAARRGDSDASLRLKALEETITEQSIRLTGKARPPSTVFPPPQ